MIRQTEELKQKGYYTLNDGSISTDEQNKDLFKVKAKAKKNDEQENWQHPPPKRAMTAWTFFNSEKYQELAA